MLERNRARGRTELQRARTEEEGVGEEQGKNGAAEGKNRGRGCWWVLPCSTTGIITMPVLLIVLVVGGFQSRALHCIKSRHKVFQRRGFQLVAPNRGALLVGGFHRRDRRKLEKGGGRVDLRDEGMVWGENH